MSRAMRSACESALKVLHGRVCRGDCTWDVDKWSQLVGKQSLGLRTLHVYGHWTNLTLDLMRNLDNFYNGLDYATPVEFGKVYVHVAVLTK